MGPLGSENGDQASYAHSYTSFLGRNWGLCPENQVPSVRDQKAKGHSVLDADL
jgi:hypothetical protein